MKYDRLSIAAIVLGTLLAITAAVPVSSTPGRSSQESPDTRPLRSLMTELGQEMSRIGDGIWRDDFEMIESSAARIAGHPRVPARQREVIEEALLERFPQFVALDRAVHSLAADVAERAGERDMPALLEAHERLQRACVACHATYRDPVRHALWRDELPKPADTAPR